VRIESCDKLAARTAPEKQSQSPDCGLRISDCGLGDGPAASGLLRAVPPNKPNSRVTAARGRGTHGRDASLYYTSRGGRTAISDEKWHISFYGHLLSPLSSVCPDQGGAPSRQEAAFKPQKRHILIPTTKKMCRGTRRDAHATERLTASPRTGLLRQTNPISAGAF
jgi:hypothetical protein